MVIDTNGQFKIHDTENDSSQYSENISYKDKVKESLTILGSIRNQLGCKTGNAVISSIIQR